MNAVEHKYVAKNRRTTRVRSTKANRRIAREIVLRIFANSTLSVIALIALFKLIPYQLKQQKEIQEMNQEIQETENRVNKLRDNFSYNFDPSQSRKIMQEVTPKVDPNLRRLFFVKDNK